MTKFISWVEIPTLNFDRALSFYNSVFRLNMQGEDYGIEKMACFPSGEGAIIEAKGYQPSEHGVVVSFLVPDSIDETIERIKANGGKIIQPKTKIESEEKGYFAIFTDSEGNRIGLHEKV
jgi:uncharacterized protein